MVRTLGLGCSCTGDCGLAVGVVERISGCTARCAMSDVVEHACDVAIAAAISIAESLSPFAAEPLPIF